jgi:adenine-specific DNA-methyltransferase
MEKKKQRGQFFTTNEKVLKVLVSLIRNDGDIFEPSAGSGHIIDAVEKVSNQNIFACELDSQKVNEKICKTEIEVKNFFDYIKNNRKYSTVIGNPPFVKLKNVEDSTINSLPEKIKANGNLYYFFIKYSLEVLIENGELIFIVPKEWLYNTSSQFLRDYLAICGNFTHFIDCGEEKLFEDADVPALCIFRFQKNYDGVTNYYNSIEDYNNNILSLRNVIYDKTISFSTKKPVGRKISDLFDVKVGLVTGLESVFKLNDEIDIEDDCVINMMTTTKQHHRYLYVEEYNNIENIPPLAREYLLKNKDELMNRKIKTFNENNWWKYGAIRNIDMMKSNLPRIYGLMKTRDTNPFWVGEPNSYFSGGVFALFPKVGNNLEISLVVDYLNSENFKKLLSESNMFSNNKVSFTPSAFSSLITTFNLL